MLGAQLDDQFGLGILTTDGHRGHRGKMERDPLTEKVISCGIHTGLLLNFNMELLRGGITRLKR
jgi:hypothetical protein